MASKHCPKNPSDLKAHMDFLGWHEREAIREQVFARDVPLCVWCIKPVSHKHGQADTYTVDHIRCRAEGGLFECENLVLACKDCNNRRSNLSVLQFMAKRAHDDHCHYK